ncbi:hypothetical protein SDC9_46651 [bioreactor metagenome]|uniref:Uncharacterized protein n=1 Tax=bioreactor metagenome TaxID=1076179 RepID=A0A644WA94_9ZZZZ
MTLSALRRRAEKEGYRIVKGRDPFGIDGYNIIDANNVLVAGEHFALDINDLETWFEKPVISN